jgi:DNA-binding SARP family transcriptional activator/Tfp pilus assembly protein PilF
VDFRLLGRVEIRIDGQKVDLGPAESPRVRCILAVLLRTPAALVSTEAVISRVWGDSPPGAAVRYKYIGWLRAALAPLGVPLIQRDNGYLLDVSPELVDLHRFRRLAVEAGHARTAGQGAQAVTLLRRALGLWDGQPLAGLGGSWVDLFREQLERERRDAIVAYARASLDLGQHGALAGELAGWQAEYPTDETITELHMLALYRDGQQRLALGCYERARERIRAELAAEPGPALTKLYERVQARDPALLPRAAPPHGKHAPADLAHAVPRQLPPAIRHFVGRDRQTRELARLLAAAGRDGQVSMAVLDGTPGVGKTALAIRWAHQIADQFGDGQLYVNLRGYGPMGAPLASAQALHGFLVALSVPPGQIPVDIEARCSLYRTLLAGKRMLVLLDNARDAAQVRPLLPGSPGCMVIITSRSQLVSLVAAEGAKPVTLGLLTEAEAAELLTQRLGTRRVANEPSAVGQLIAAAAGLPLALNVIAARAEIGPSLPLDALSAGLHDARSRLDALSTGDPATDVRAVLSWSCAQLSAPANRMFRLLGLHAGPDISLPAAACLSGNACGQASRSLAELVSSHLLTEQVPGRFACHDLLMAYATELVGAQEHERERTAARRRLLDYYLYHGHAAAMALNPARVPLRLEPSQRPVALRDTPDREHAEDWFTAESPAILNIVMHTAEVADDRHVWQLSWILADFMQQQGRWQEWAAMQEIALVAAQRLSDPEGQARSCHYLGYAQARLGSYHDAHRHLDEALHLFRQLSDQASQAHVHLTAAIALEQQGRIAAGLGRARKSLELYRSADHPAGQANALNAVGWYLTLTGQPQQAVPYCEHAISLHRELGNGDGEAATWDSLGHVHQQLGEHDKAIDCYLRAIGLRPVSGDRYNQAGTLVRLGDTHRAADSPHMAREAWQQALGILEEMRHPDAGQVRALLSELDGGFTAAD